MLRSSALKVSALVFLIVGFGALATMTTSAGAASKRIQTASCYPAALVPYVNAGAATAKANVTCDSGAPTWSYTIRLVDSSSGTILDEKSGSGLSGSLQVLGHIGIQCSGISVHTFFYLNVGGVGKSDTSGSVTC